MDAAFPLGGESLPLDYGYALFGAVSRVVPVLHGPPSLGARPPTPYSLACCLPIHGPHRWEPDRTVRSCAQRRERFQSTGPHRWEPDVRHRVAVPAVLVVSIHGPPSLGARQQQAPNGTDSHRRAATGSAAQALIDPLAVAVSPEFGFGAAAGTLAVLQTLLAQAAIASLGKRSAAGRRWRLVAAIGGRLPWRGRILAGLRGSADRAAVLHISEKVPGILGSGIVPGIARGRVRRRRGIARGRGIGAVRRRPCAGGYERDHGSGGEDRFHAVVQARESGAELKARARLGSDGRPGCAARTVKKA